MTIRKLLPPILRPTVHAVKATPHEGQPREPFERELNASPGLHLVIVRYAPAHDVHSEYVYNRADIDRAKVVWAREIPGVDINPLLAYFRERRVWLLEPDASPPRLTPYSELSAE
jgi:hypothetical protein